MRHHWHHLMSLFIFDHQILLSYGYGPTLNGSISACSLIIFINVCFCIYDISLKYVLGRTNLIPCFRLPPDPIFFADFIFT